MSDNSRYIKKGIIWNSLSSFFRYVLQFGGIMILARLLSPNDYGVFGLMAIFISIAEVLMDGGLCAAVIKKENASDLDFSTLAVYNISASIILYLTFYIVAPFIEQFYDCQNLSTYLRVYSITIVLHGLVMAHRTYAIKSMRFKFLSLTTMTSGFVGLVVAIVMAYLKFGVFSLIGQYLANAIVYSATLYTRSHYHVKMGFSGKSFKEQFAFGINTTVANTLKTISENIYNNVIGKTCQLNQVGYYTQSNKLMQVPVAFFFTLIDTTFFPVMSQIHDKTEFVKNIVRLNTNTLKIIIPLFTLAISLNKEIVYFLLGEKWHGAESTLLILLVSGLIITWGNIGRNLIKCTGKTFLILKYEAVIFLISMFGLFVSAKFGYTYIVFCFLVVSIIKAIYITTIANKEVGIKFLDVLRPLYTLIVICVLYLLCAGCFGHFLLPIGLVLKLVVSALLAFFYIRKFEGQLYVKIKRKIMSITHLSL